MGGCRNDRSNGGEVVLKNLFSPISIGKMEIANRLAVAPMVTQYCNSDGASSERWIAYHEGDARHVRNSLEAVEQGRRAGLEA
jgi:hypothetical protein